MWTHPFNRPGASRELLLVAKASLAIQEAATRAVVGREIPAPQWAWDAVEAFQVVEPSYDWDTMMTERWQAEKTAAYHAAWAAEKARKAQEAADMADLFKGIDTPEQLREFIAANEGKFRLDKIVAVVSEENARMIRLEALHGQLIESRGVLWTLGKAPFVPRERRKAMGGRK